MNSHWKQRPEGGSRFAFHLIRFIASNGGRAIARLTLYPIVAYFLLVRGPERRASRAYLARVLDRAPGLGAAEGIAEPGQRRAADQRGGQHREADARIAPPDQAFAGMDFGRTHILLPVRLVRDRVVVVRRRTCFAMVWAKYRCASSLFWRCACWPATGGANDAATP